MTSTPTSSPTGSANGSSSGQGKWTADEHARFLEALRWFPCGPWKAIANHVGTRSIRQVQTHTQKYVEKTRRRARGLLKVRRDGDGTDHEVDEQVTALCMSIRRRTPTTWGTRRSSVTRHESSESDSTTLSEAAPSLGFTLDDAATAELTELELEAIEAILQSVDVHEVDMALMVSMAGDADAP